MRGVLNDRLPWLERRPDNAEGAGRRSTREALAARETDGSPDPQTPITTREHARSRELDAPAPLLIENPFRRSLQLTMVTDTLGREIDETVALHRDHGAVGAWN